MNWKHPGPVVWAVFVAEMIGLWIVAGLKYFYDLDVDPLDLRIQMTIFVTGAAWWTEIMRDS